MMNSIFRTDACAVKKLNRHGNLTFKIIVFILMSSAFLYTCLRAYYLSITHDEAVTYLLFASSPYIDIIFNLVPAGPYRANNHLLNTILSARGYALGLGFFMLGLYGLIKSSEITHEIHTPRFSFIMFTLATMSTLTFLNVYLTLFCMLALMELYKCNHNIKQFLTNIIKSVSYTLPLLIIIYIVPIFILRQGQLYFGGTHGFWHDTVRSLIHVSFYGQPYLTPFAMMISEIFVGVVLLSSIIFIFTNYKPRFDNTNKVRFVPPGRVVTLLFVFLVMSAFLTILQHHLLGTRFLIERTAIFFIPLFLLLACVLFKNIAVQRNRLSSTVMFLWYAWIIIISGHYMSSLNIHAYLDWQYDSDTKHAINDLHEWAIENDLDKTPRQVGINWIFEPSINYYIKKNKLDWLQFANRNGPDGEFDYYYVVGESHEILSGHTFITIHDLVIKHNLIVIKEYPISNTYLAVSATR